MLNLRYIIRETRDGWRRGRLSFLFSVLIMTFLLILVGVIGILSLNTDRIVEVINTRFDIQAFVANTLNEKEISRLGTALRALPGVDSVDFFSKTEAAEQFSREFGEDLFNVVGENPLPSSFLVKLTPDNQTFEHIYEIAEQIQAIDGIEEVVYHEEALRILSGYSSIAKTVQGIVLVFVIIGSLVIIFHNVRLAIMSKQQIIETMKLVGATRRFIRIPYYLQGFVQGILGGIVAFMLLYALVRFINQQVPNFLYVPLSSFFMVIALGGLLGLLASAIAIRRFL
ncbi:FtsX-like permease family protein [candidate division KSB1 bacterium]|nr:FtsX-like permease family protein [candidate division KSB1 bacterium]